MLEATGLKKTYGPITAVNDVSIAVRQGEILGLLGPNGAGKTTTVSMICGITKPDAGRITIDGQPLRGDTDPVKQRIGLVPQDIALYDELSAHDNLRFFGGLYGLSGAALDGKMREALTFVGLAERATDLVGAYSGGMKRRLNIAASLLHEPAILLLDEPTAGVDPQSRSSIFDALEALREAGKALVYTTHYMEEAERLCDRIVIIDHGKVIANDTLGGLYRLLPAQNRLVLELDDPSNTEWTTALGRESCVRGVSMNGARAFVELEDLVTGSAAVLSWLAVQRGTSTVAVVIPPGFGLAAARSFFGPNPKPHIQFLYDPSHGAELGMLRGILTQHVMKDVSEEAFSGPLGRQITAETLRDIDAATGMAQADRETLRNLLKSVGQLNAQSSAGSGALRAPGLSMPYEIKEEAVTSRPGIVYNGYAHAFSGMGVQFMLFAAIDGAILILLERQRGLWNRLRAAPLARTTLLAGKAISSTIIASATILVLFAVGAIFFKIRILGSLPGFLAVVVACAFMASTYGLLIAALGKTPGATRGVAIFATLVLVMLGGAWMPSFLFPAWIQQATLFIPTRWAVDGLQTMSWRGLGFTSALPAVGALLGFGALFGTIAALRFRWD